jgi:excisionase family DNA binding protein
VSARRAGFPRMLTGREVAAMLHLHQNTVKRIGDRGELPFVRVTSRGDRRYHPADVSAYLERMGGRS